jgi:cyclophilin family peptidyl-prolyl cis-trans isomerase
MKVALTGLVLSLFIHASLQELGKIGKNPVSANKVEVTDYAAITVEIEGQEQEKKIIVGLFGKDRPQSTENFRRICKGTGRDDQGRLLSYVGSPFHRIIPGFIVQGGDVITRNGRTNSHIYQGTWKDEGDFNILHEIGCFGLANGGKDSSGSQFFIPTAPVSFLDGKQIIIGRVLKGMETVEAIEKLGSNNGKPKGQGDHHGAASWP